MNDKVQVGDEVTTLAQLADEGRVTFRDVKTETRKRQGERRERVAYIAQLIECPDGSHWEISEVAYRSRTKQPINL